MSRTDRIKPRPTVGFKAVLGTSYQLCPKVSLYAEAEYRNVSVSSKERETIAYSLEALHTASTTQIEHDLSDLSMAERKGIARKTLNAASNTPENDDFDPDKPMDEHRSYINIGGLGITAGVRIDL